MAVLSTEIKEISGTMKAHGVQGPQPQNKNLSSDFLLFNGGDKSVIMENGNMEVSVLGGNRGINQFPEATVRADYKLDGSISTPAGAVRVEAGPFAGTKLNRMGTAGLAGGSISFEHFKSGTTVSCEGSVSTSSAGNLSSQNTPNTMASCGLSFRF